ncbi:MarR family winged helix-turn-helix transcriptional regulator [Nocardiopsis oceani]
MVHDEPGSPSSGEALDRLLAVSTLISDDMSAGLGEIGLTRARATALWEIARHGTVTQRQLADLLSVTPRNVTKLLDALQRDGFVSRTSDTDDRRAILVRLTAQGEESTASLKEQAAALADDLFGDVPPDELASFVHALDRVAVYFADPPETTGPAPPLPEGSGATGRVRNEDCPA